MVRRGVLVGSREVGWSEVAGLALALVLGALAVTLVYQVPVRHTINIGGYDAAYVQGFADAERNDETPRPYLVGSDGSARWSGAVSSLLFPQAGLPAQVTLRMSGWRSEGPTPNVTVLLNGRESLGSFSVGPDWQDYPLIINGGLLKANDFFLELRADTTRLPDDGREVGVLLDRVEYRVGPGFVTPYPAQIVYAMLAAGLLWALLQFEHYPLQTDRRKRRFALYGCLILLCWFLFYRNQPPFYPYPLIGFLPAVDIGLASVLALRMWQHTNLRDWLQTRLWLLDLLGFAGIAVWAGAVWQAAQAHLTLARPGVENDFRVFATRDTIERVFQADGFYNLGYPLLLWLVRPLVFDNAFLAGRLIALASGVLLLASSFWLAKLVFRNRPPLVQRSLALMTLLLLALSPLVVEYGLYVGSDGPFAALVTLALTLLFAGTREQPRPTILFAAGLAGGATYLVRHLGLVLLPWGIVVCWLLAGPYNARRTFRKVLLLFTGGFLLAMLPQLVANTWQTGQPLFNQQAKNVWLCVYGNCDWGRWDEAPNSIGLADVILRDPERFFANWTGNIRAFVGTGGEDTSEFGRAIQLRLLGWPANWFAIAGLLGWLVVLAKDRRRQTGDVRQETQSLIGVSLLLLLMFYVVAVCMAFALPRFFLPLAPIYALAATWSCWAIFRYLSDYSTRWRPAIGLSATIVLVWLMWSGFAIGTRYVIDGQPADEVAAMRLIEAHLHAGEQVAVCIPPEIPLGKYSTIAHQATLCPTDADGATALRSANGAAYLLWSSARGDAPLPASDLVGRAGPYGLYQLR